MNKKTDESVDIEDLLSHERFLVSPFNNIDKFINDEYWLTSSQTVFKNKILKGSKNYWVRGEAGTGKTLLVYDLAKEYMNGGVGKKVLIIHGGNLNEGQISLMEDKYNIIAIKELMDEKIADFDLIIIDEMQRLEESQVKKIIDDAKQAKVRVIFAGDPKQTLNWVHNRPEIGEAELNSDKKRENFCKKYDIVKGSLDKKIRTNKKLVSFIEVKNNKEDIKEDIREYVTFVYFNDKDVEKVKKSALHYLLWREEVSESKILSIPGTRYNSDFYNHFCYFKSSFEAIGQEFDSVTTIVGPNVSYDSKGKLWSDGTYYPSHKSLEHNMLRARKNLHFVIINNPVFLDRVLELLEAGIQRNMSTKN